MARYRSQYFVCETREREREKRCAFNDLKFDLNENRCYRINFVWWVEATCGGGNEKFVMINAGLSARVYLHACYVTKNIFSSAGEQSFWSSVFIKHWDSRRELRIGVKCYRNLTAGAEPVALCAWECADVRMLTAAFFPLTSHTKFVAFLLLASSTGRTFSYKAERKSNANRYILHLCCSVFHAPNFHWYFTIFSQYCGSWLS